MQNVKKPRRGSVTLTESQQRTFVKVVLSVVFLGLLWVIFAPNSGLLALSQAKKAQRNAEEENLRLEAQNKVLQKEIQQFNEDPVFLEKVARENGFLKKGELVFDFGKKEKK